MNCKNLSIAVLTLIAAGCVFLLVASPTRVCVQLPEVQALPDYQVIDGQLDEERQLVTLGPQDDSFGNAAIKRIDQYKLMFCTIPKNGECSHPPSKCE